MVVSFQVCTAVNEKLLEIFLISHSEFFGFFARFTLAQVDLTFVLRERKTQNIGGVILVSVNQIESFDAGGRDDYEVQTIRPAESDVFDRLE